ncbi:unnamed protein product [Penicillium roqueforti FM164]|uniref:Genomic scaffold, ProqFM164S02 n=1 Tax=Penicillium roqueforti (strain FM164) TaxID=1365484 RepID=W6QRW2_PENRF|nr:unnamed protein product [Penicillium roqueforti FM164]
MSLQIQLLFGIVHTRTSQPGAREAFPPILSYPDSILSRRRKSQLPLGSVPCSRIDSVDRTGKKLIIADLITLLRNYHGIVSFSVYDQQLLEMAMIS